MPDLAAPLRLLGRDRLIVATALVLAVLLAGWFVLAGSGTGMSALQMTTMTGPQGALLGQAPDMVSPQHWSPGYAWVIFLMWWLMMVAMMIPSAAPTILLFGALYPNRGIAGMAAFLAGYLAVWAAMSAAATAVQGVLAAYAMVSAMYMSLAAPALAAAVLIGAGLYQLTPIKQACLDHCRGPVAALTRHRRQGRFAAFRMGVTHGTFCLGCCWALMALLFVGGIMNIWWILGLSLYVGLEKLAPFGGRLAKPMAFVLVLAGLVLLARTSAVI